MNQDPQEEQHISQNPQQAENILPPDLLEEVNALRQKVDTLDNALKTVVKKPE